jgi:alkylhydroperoxidase family enzyme
MKPRMNYYQAAPDTIKALVAVEDQIKASGLELSLIELVKTRASHITHAPDADYEAMQAYFSESEAVNLTTLIGAINAWNRIAIGFRAIYPVRKAAAA